MLRLWTNFAKSGDPNLPDPGPVSWRPLTPESEAFLDIGPMEMSVPNNYHQRSQFWSSVFSRPAPVTTAEGPVIGGFLTTVSGRTIRSFQGIPYAAPPVGVLRLASPVPAQVRESLYDAGSLGPACPQGPGPYEVPEGQSEDCLFLNIYSPLEVASPLPVLVYLHGGSLTRGSGGTYFHGPEILLDSRDIVMVTINYRLGPLGLLTLESPELVGNQALRDQALALAWVRDNIQSFGGDPGQVTLAGQSAGAFSVGTHMVSPPSFNLFHRAVAMSGSPVRITGTDTTLAPGSGRRVALDLANHLNCSTSLGDAALVACLREKPLQDILASDWIFSHPNTGALQTRKPYSWIVDSQFADEPVLPMLQEEAFASGDFLRVPLMIGVTKDEGLYNAAKYILDPQALANLNDNWDEIGPKIVFDKKENVTEDEREIVSRIRQFYFGDNDIDESQIEPLVNMFSDKTFWSSVHRTVTLIADQPAAAPVYLYMFSHTGAWSFAQLFDLPPRIGVCHADDVHYLFQV